MFLVLIVVLSPLPNVMARISRQKYDRRCLNMPQNTVVTQITLRRKTAFILPTLFNQYCMFCATAAEQRRKYKHGLNV